MKYRAIKQPMFLPRFPAPKLYRSRTSAPVFKHGRVTSAEQAAKERGMQIKVIQTQKNYSPYIPISSTPFHCTMDIASAAYMNQDMNLSHWRNQGSVDSLINMPLVIIRM